MKIKSNILGANPNMVAIGRVFYYQPEYSKELSGPYVYLGVGFYSAKATKPAILVNYDKTSRKVNGHFSLIDTTVFEFEEE